MDSLDLTVKIGWRRQHPEFENLFWCPECGQYKDRGDFNKHKRGGVYSSCRQCHSNSATQYININRSLIRERCATYRENNRGSFNASSRYHKAISRVSLGDLYIKNKLHQQNLPITPETIELKRAQIQMKRTLKEFKKWNEENIKQEGVI